MPDGSFFRGFFAGVLAGIPMNLWSLFSYHVLDFGSVRLLDWMGVILYGTLPTTFVEQAYALWVQIIALGTLGILYAYLLSVTGSLWYVGKAVIYSGAVSFGAFSITSLFHLPHLSELSLNAVFSNHIGAGIWGIALGWILQRLDAGARMKE